MGNCNWKKTGLWFSPVQSCRLNLQILVAQLSILEPHPSITFAFHVSSEPPSLGWGHIPHCLHTMSCNPHHHKQAWPKNYDNCPRKNKTAQQQLNNHMPNIACMPHHTTPTTTNSPCHTSHYYILSYNHGLGLEGFVHNTTLFNEKYIIYISQAHYDEDLFIKGLVVFSKFSLQVSPFHWLLFIAGKPFLLTTFHYFWYFHWLRFYCRPALFIDHF